MLATSLEEKQHYVGTARIDVNNMCMEARLFWLAWLQDGRKSMRGRLQHSETRYTQASEVVPLRTSYSYNQGLTFDRIYLSFYVNFVSSSMPFSTSLCIKIPSTLITKQTYHSGRL